jgi:hypothetical protein
VVRGRPSGIRLFLIFFLSFFLFFFGVFSAFVSEHAEVASHQRLQVVLFILRFAAYLKTRQKKKPR